MRIHSTENEPCLMYFKLISLLSYLSDFFDEIEFYSNIIFFEANRNSQYIENSISLSNGGMGNVSRFQNMIQEKNNVQSIRQNTSFIPYVTKKLARIHRAYEAKSRVHDFQNDNFVFSLDRALQKYNFEISIELIDQDSNQYELTINKGKGKKKAISTFSSGEKELLNIILGIIGLNIESGIIIIDEPEMHLHPEWQTILLNALMDIAKTRKIQIIFATHSSSFITPKNLNNIFRVYMDNYLVSRVATLNPVLIESQFKNFYRIINATNNNILFFCSKIVLVEGIIDKMIVETIIEKEFIEERELNDIAVLVLGSKTCLKLYINLLDNLKIKWCFIGDLDNLNELSSPELLKGKKNIDKALFHKNINKGAAASNDAKMFYDKIEEAISNNNMEKLKEFFEILKARFSKWSEEGINNDEIRMEIENLKHQGYYLLPKGDIEDYYLDEYRKKKALEMVDDMLMNKYEEWKKTEQFRELKSIVSESILSFS